MSKAWSNKIMTNLRLTILVFTLVLSGSVFAALDKVEEVLELELSSIQLPAHEVDKVVITQCADANCSSQTFEATSDTVYRIGGFDAPKVGLQEFRAAVRQALRNSRSNRGLLVYLGYAPDTNKVTRIVVSGGAE
jgi:hypothetical protein